MSRRILATDGVEQIELTSPREALEKAGAKCVLIAPKGGEIQGFKHHDKADKLKVDMELSKANEFDAVLLPGGCASRRKLNSSCRTSSGQASRSS